MKQSKDAHSTLSEDLECECCERTENPVKAYNNFGLIATGEVRAMWLCNECASFVREKTRYMFKFIMVIYKANTFTSSKLGEKQDE